MTHAVNIDKGIADVVEGTIVELAEDERGDIGYGSTQAPMFKSTTRVLSARVLVPVLVPITAARLILTTAPSQPQYLVARAWSAKLRHDSPSVVSTPGGMELSACFDQVIPCGPIYAALLVEQETGEWVTTSWTIALTILRLGER